MSEIGYLFQLSYWQTSIVFVFLIVGVITTWIVFKKKGSNWAFLTAVILGVTGGFIFMLMDKYYPETAAASYMVTELSMEIGQQAAVSSTSWQSEAMSWLEVIPGIFLSGVYFFIPLLIFSTLIVIVNKFGTKGSAKTLFTSFFSLMFFVMIGIFLAAMFTPLLQHATMSDANKWLVPETPPGAENTIPGIIGSWIPDSISIFASTKFMVSIVVAGLFIGFVTRFLIKTENKHGTSILNFFEALHTLFKTSLSWVYKLIPFMVMSKIPQLFFGDVANNMASLGIFIGIVIAGSVIVYFIATVIGTIFSRKTSSYKKYIKTTWHTTTTAFFSQSSSGTLPYTIKSTTELSNSPMVAETTPSIGTTMGLSMCGGFYPAAIAIVTALSLQAYGMYDVDATFWVILIISTMVLSIGTAGMPGTAFNTSTAVLGMLGLPNNYLTFAQTVDPIIDMFRTAANVNGVMAATMITDWFDTKVYKNTQMDNFEPFVKEEKNTSRKSNSK